MAKQPALLQSILDLPGLKPPCPGALHSYDPNRMAHVVAGIFPTTSEEL